MPELTHPEIKALSKLVDELDYYQLMELPRTASSGALKTSYYALSRRYHPDATRHLPGDVRRAAGLISKRLTEAYSVLRDPRRRRIYDQRLDSEDGRLRLQLAEAEAAADRSDLERRAGRTEQGRRFFRMAESDLERGDLASATRNLQMAATFEPENGFFKERLAEVREQLRAR